MRKGEIGHHICPFSVHTITLGTQLGCHGFDFRHRMNPQFLKIIEEEGTVEIHRKWLGFLVIRIYIRH